MRVRNWVGLSLGALLVGFSLACGGATGECTMGTTECDGDTLKACGADGKWYETPCPAGTSCGEVEGVKSCVPDDMPGGGDAGGGAGGEEGEGGEGAEEGDEGGDGAEEGGGGGGGKAKGGKGKRKAG